MPPGSIAEQIQEIGRRLNRLHFAAGNLRPVSHLHVTLLSLGDYSELEDEAVRRAMRGCEAVAAISHAFDLEFNRMVCWRGNRARIPLVLTQERRSLPLDALYQNTVIQLHRQGFGLPKKRFTPHVTTSYNRRSFPAEIVPATRWRTEELVLIHSFVGLTKYVELGRWRLGEPVMPDSAASGRRQAA